MEKKHSCPVCTKGFANATRLRQHLLATCGVKAHTNGLEGSNPVSQSSTWSEKILVEVARMRVHNVPRDAVQNMKMHMLSIITEMKANIIQQLEKHVEPRVGFQSIVDDSGSLLFVISPLRPPWEGHIPDCYESESFHAP